MNNFYTGIGSSKAPEDICLLARSLGAELCAAGWDLHSGGDNGFDREIEQGVVDKCLSAEGSVEIRAEVFIPWTGFAQPVSKYCAKYVVPEDTEQIRESLRSTVVPWFDSLSFADALRSVRDVYCLYGTSQDKQSKFVLYWSPGDPLEGPRGNTKTTVLLAQREGIPTYHLGDPLQVKEFRSIWLGDGVIYPSTL